jgi:hypothetical protein
MKEALGKLLFWVIILGVGSDSDLSLDREEDELEK